ncbi:MAG TPA: hypothetical protein PLL30_12880 [Candidatus Krumholzibacteria bacterium]|nr:hypothetical protein [Candidatus Krumholzibacteria bacterium]HPD72664.1 hypothetical protein [Candidatus Krumholzibacteria bacterium]HRY40404.1 hypothetical protein [Candidatus Krumholzibacteria bacterium]
MIRRAVRLNLAASMLALAPAAVAAEQVGEGVTFLGAGFTGKPFALAGEVILETDGSFNCARDYTDPEHPVWISWHDVSTGTGFWDTVLYEDGLVVALLENLAAGAYFVDFSDPASPRDLGGFAGNTYTSGLLHRQHLYLSLSNLIIVYDMTVPDDPQFRAAFLATPRGEPRWFAASGDHVYFIEAANVVRCLDASEPDAPADLGTFVVAGDDVDALVAGRGALYAIVTSAIGDAANRVDLVTLRLDAPTQPVETARRPLATGLDARGLRLVADGDLLLAAESGGTVHAFDLAEPLEPEPVWTLPVWADHLTVTGDHIFLVSGDELRIHARAGREPPPLAAVRQYLPALETVTGEGTLQIAQAEKDLSLLLCLDLTNPTCPRLVSEFDAGLDGRLFVRDDLAVLVDATDFRIVDVADPAAPRLRGTARFAVEGLTNHVALSRKLAAFGRLNAYATDLYDVVDPDRPTLLSRIPGQVFPIAVDRSTLLFFDFGQIRIFDVSDPYKPHDYGDLPLDGQSTDAVIVDDLAYVVSVEETGPKLYVLDVGDPASARVLASIRLDASGSLVTYGDRLYTRSYSRVQVIDISARLQPVYTAWFQPAFPPTTGLAADRDVITVSNRLITVRDDSWLPAAVDEDGPRAACRLEDAYPNPGNPGTTFAFSVDRPRELTLAIHDLRGRRVADLARGTFGPGRHTVAWRGLDAGGRPVASGVYVVRLHGPGVEATGTVTLVK